MKKSNWSDALSAFTKGTIITCGVLLVVTAVTVMILMFFPIQKEDHPTVVVEPARHTEFSATTHATTARTETSETGTHTLSTWNAGIHGFNSDVREHLGTVDTRYTTTDPRLTRRETTSTRKGQVIPETTLAEGEIPFLMPPTTERPETTTTTVTEVWETPEESGEISEEEITAPPLPVEEET